MFYNFDFKTIEFFDGNSWRQVDNTTRRGRGFILVGIKVDSHSTQTNSIDFIQISTLGNAQNFGDLILLLVKNAHGSGNLSGGIPR